MQEIQQEGLNWYLISLMHFWFQKLKRKKYGLRALCLNIPRGLTAISRKPRKMKRPRLPTRGAVMHYQEVTLSSVNSGLLI